MNEMLPTNRTEAHDNDSVGVEFRKLMKRFNLDDNPSILESETWFEEIYSEFNSVLTKTLGRPVVSYFSQKSKPEVVVRKIFKKQNASQFTLVLSNFRIGTISSGDRCYIPLIAGQGATKGQALFDAIGNLANGGINVFDNLEEFK